MEREEEGEGKVGKTVVELLVVRIVVGEEWKLVEKVVDLRPHPTERRWAGS